MSYLPKYSAADWWRWGDPSNADNLDDHPKFKAFLETQFGNSLAADFSVPDLLAQVPESPFSTKDLFQLFPSIPPEQLSTSALDRIRFGFGKSYHDLIRIFSGDAFRVADLVIFPKSNAEIEEILRVATAQKFAIIPFGGGSNVTGALDLPTGENPQKTICLSLQKMSGMLSIDEISNRATFLAGTYGPELEAKLNGYGYTLGHFPQSFEYSTLGGWVVTRSAGQESGQYGKIEDIIQGFKVVSPAGILEFGGYPRHAGGVDLQTLFVGSEGTLGVVTEVQVAIHPIPKGRKWLIPLFKDFESGINAIREMVQHGVHPAIARLSDESETKAYSKISSKEYHGLQKWIRDRVKAKLQRKGYGSPSLMMLGFTEKNTAASVYVKEAKRIAQKHGAYILPASSAATWEEGRFSLPYLRDSLISHRVLIDTFETVASWQDLVPLYQHIRQSLKSQSDFFKVGGTLLSHLSHVYSTGSSLYCTLLAPQEAGNELAQWQQYKTIVTQALVEKGGAISHHHGVGADHLKWYQEGLSPLEKKLFQQIKNTLDPGQILNPGKLFHEAQGEHKEAG